MIKFSWFDFDKGIEYAYKKYKNQKFIGVYGIPRGGLCLAVKLSHYLNIPLLDLPQDNCLIVDDIYDSGKTLKKYKDYVNCTYFVLISKEKPTWFDSYKYTGSNDWIIFAWENVSNAENDKLNYYAKN